MKIISEVISMQEICEVGVFLLDAGLASRTWGNISVRKDSKSFYVTPSGISYRKLSSDDMVEVDIQSGCYEETKNPSSEMHMHRLIYMNHPDVDAVLHTHQPLASAIGSTIPHIMEEFYFREQQACPNKGAYSYSLKSACVESDSQENSPRLDDCAVVSEQHSLVSCSENAENCNKASIFCPGSLGSDNSEECVKNLTSSGVEDGYDHYSRENLIWRKNTESLNSSDFHDISAESGIDFSCGFVPHLVSGSMELAEAVCEQLKSNEAVLLANHGCVFVAKTQRAGKTFEMGEADDIAAGGRKVLKPDKVNASDKTNVLDQVNEAGKADAAAQIHRADGADEAPEVMKNTFPPLYTALNLSLSLEARCRNLLSCRYPAEILRADLFACECREDSYKSSQRSQVLNPLIEMLISRSQRELKSYIDDFAQLFGESLTIDADRGVIFSEYDIDDLPAAVSIINKNALTQLIATDNDIAPPDAEKVEQMHRNYIEKYSRLNSQH